MLKASPSSDPFGLAWMTLKSPSYRCRPMRRQRGSMIAIGPDAFADFLDGAHAMDRHFVETPLEENPKPYVGMYINDDIN